MKRCAGCQTEKPKVEFSIKRAANDGLYPYCKPCDRQRIKLWHQNNPGKNNQRQKQYYLDNPQKLTAFYDRRAADPIRVQRRKEVQTRNKKRRLAEAQRKGLRLSRKVEEESKA